MEQQMNSQPPALATLRPDVPPGLADAVMRALDKDPARRHQTARDFAVALGGAVPRPLEGERPAARSRAGLWLLIAAAVAVAVLVITLLRRA
jgi:hypothetical protein